jgi:hypothetical protein
MYDSGDQNLLPVGSLSPSGLDSTPSVWNRVFTSFTSATMCSSTGVAGVGVLPGIHCPKSSAVAVFRSQETPLMDICAP